MVIATSLDSRQILTYAQPIPKSARILQLLNYRLKITMQDGRTLIGEMLAFDKHMNLVLSECEEIRRTKSKSTVERRSLGLIILRGEGVVSISVEAPPKTTATTTTTTSTPGVAKPMGRGLPVAPNTALMGPARGMGGPGLQAMQTVPGAPTIPGFIPAFRPGMMPPPGFRPGMMPMPPPGFRPGMMPPPGFRPPQ